MLGRGTGTDRRNDTGGMFPRKEVMRKNLYPSLVLAGALALGACSTVGDTVGGAAIGAGGGAAAGAVATGGPGAGPGAAIGAAAGAAGGFLYSLIP